tara:strand:- start:9561 stop:9665 length:105 start_codon:yes stop_codon:yes gene_type:complete
MDWNLRNPSPGTLDRVLPLNITAKDDQNTMGVLE